MRSNVFCLFPVPYKSKKKYKNTHVDSLATRCQSYSTTTTTTKVQDLQEKDVSACVQKQHISVDLDLLLCL